MSGRSVFQQQLVEEIRKADNSWGFRQVSSVIPVGRLVSVGLFRFMWVWQNWKSVREMQCPPACTLASSTGRNGLPWPTTRLWWATGGLFVEQVVCALSGFTCLAAV